jgi:alkylation response protein AidB-like acyl-CoA dehydrogenase
MLQVFEQESEQETINYQTIAAKASAELAATAVDRDAQAGIPEQEVEVLRQHGLLKLPIPKAYGGLGANWPEIYKAVQTIAKADGSTGQLYANHACLVNAAYAMGRPGQAEHYYQLTAEQNLFWGNAFNTRDTRLKIEPEGDHFRLNGVKSFGTGVVVADLRSIAAFQEGNPFPIAAVLPKDREGVVYNQDWDNMGQRRTASGSFTFNNVWVSADEIMGPPPNPESIFPTLIFLVVQLSKTHVYLGIAEGALEAAKQYTLTQARPWMMADVTQASHDPYILHQYGELWTELQAAIALSDRAAQQVQQAWEQGQALTVQTRGDIAISVYAAKAMAIKAGLAITNRIFDTMGARATAANYGFDRYWRDLRTFSLHDPIAYKYRAIGDWALHQTLPMPSQYS